MKDEKPACGTMTELVKTEGVRVARCSCGTVHVTFQRTGVSVQLGPEYFAEVVQALSLAKTLSDGASAAPIRTHDQPRPSGFVTIVPAPFKKPTN